MDVIIFPIIEWSHRYQRPQHFASQFSKDGNRVFYSQLSFSGVGNKVNIQNCAENLWQFSLPGPIDYDRFRENLSDELIEVCVSAILEMANQFHITTAILLVQQPFWTQIVVRLKALTGWKIIFDCMDEHEGLTALNNSMVLEEKVLTKCSDLVITTSEYLFKKHVGIATKLILVPNACDYEHFSHPPLSADLLQDLPKPIIGYYGAIMEWFDVDMICRAAMLRPNWSFVLIGNLDIDAEELKKHANITLLGEIPYAILQQYLHQFDIAIIPFKLIPIIQATNPVKFYEYLSAGKPVISTRLPELEKFQNLHYVADTGDELISQAELALSQNTSELVEMRMSWAQHQTWNHRYLSLKNEISKMYPKVSIVIVSYENLEQITACLESLRKYTNYPNFEVIIVDNNSEKKVVEYIKSFIKDDSRFMLIALEENVGFSKGNNIGLDVVSQESEYIALLNNDVVVTRDWIAHLVAWLDRDSRIGMVGPVTLPNGSANEAAVSVPYRSQAEMQEFATSNYYKNLGCSFDIPILAMYCVVFKKEILNIVGKLDEQYGIGMFEDDDYSLRIRNAGLRVVCAQDVFVHHVGRSSFGKLEDEFYLTLFEKNKNIYEDKWGIKWRPPTSRNFKMPIEDYGRGWESGAKIVSPIKISGNKSVSIILVNFNGLEDIKICLKSLDDLDYPKDKIEVLVVDNASQDDSVKWLRNHYPKITLIENSQNIGFSRACNQGAEYAKGEYLAFLNNDMRVHPDWLKEMLCPFSLDPKIGVVGSAIFDWYGRDLEFAGRFDDMFSLAYEALPQKIVPENVSDNYSLMVSGGALMIEKSLYAKVNGFDPRYFMYHEDVDLCWRLWILGYKCYVATKSIAYHRGGAASNKLPSKLVSGWAQKHVIWTILKNFDNNNLREYLPLLIFYLVQRGTWNKASVESLLEVLEETQSALSSILHTRQLIQSNRKLSDEDIFSVCGNPFAFIKRSPLFNLALKRVTNISPKVEMDLANPAEVASSIRAWFDASILIRNEYHWLFKDEAVYRFEKIKKVPQKNQKELIGDHFEINNKNEDFFVFNQNFLKFRNKIIKSSLRLKSYIILKITKPLKPIILRKNSLYFDSIKDSSVQQDKVSIVIVTYNNLDFTKACLHSINLHTGYSNLEIIVVDNASSDGTKEYLREWQKLELNRIFIDNEDNRGFSAANNQGINISSGKYIVLLNNDTYVTPYWISKLLFYYKSIGEIGLIGPVTNNIGNEAKIQIDYSNIDEMLKLSADHMAKNTGKVFEINTLAFFCVMFSRDIYNQVGPLDEAYGIGFFEDDDYCRRVQAIGRKIVCAEDIFIHHHLSASFSKKSSNDRENLFNKNMKIYEAKWGKWTPHSYRR